MATASASMTGLSNLTDLLNFDMKEALSDALEAGLEAGETAMKEAINTRGTGETWSREWKGRSGSYPGRVDNGDMVGDVRGIETASSKHYAEGNLGWDEDSPAYYAYQDQGFTHVLTNEVVEGMRALTDAAEVTRNVLIREAEQIAGRL